ncbi:MULTISPECIES: hypothetical protein [unclassified Rickettsia]|uniref:hypothetical protein n=1 Tax=unclassified Rickettsia TaxID=114295 RepID=UPI0020A1E488|nr:hypothetical protein [Rickettsia endosymbiont of Ceutorhynchus assimilis]
MTKDIIDTIDSLYNFIAKLIILLEDELTVLTLQRNENNIVATKNIAETLNKLVNLIAQLNKLSNLTPTSTEIGEKDKIIIDNFLKNYQTKMLF